MQRGLLRSQLSSLTFKCNMKEAENIVTKSTCLLKDLDEYLSLCEYFYNVKSFRNTMLTYIQSFRRDFTLLYYNQKWYFALYVVKYLVRVVLYFQVWTSNSNQITCHWSTRR